MRHQEAGRKLGVSAPHRKAMLRSLTLALIERDAIKTTRSRAKELRWYAEHVVTLAKYGDLASRRQIVSLLGSTKTQPKGRHDNRVRSAIARIYSDLAPRFKDRNGGYTQILKLVQRRVGDNADLCVIRYLPKIEEKSSKKAKSKESVKKKQESSKAESKKAEDKHIKAAQSDRPVAKKKSSDLKESASSKSKKEEKIEDK